MPTSHFAFDSDVLHSVAGGRSAIDIPRLNIRTLAEADAFIASYGFDLSQPDVAEKLWYFHRRALVLLTERLGFSPDQIPEVLRERKNLDDVRQLLLFASSREAADRELQRWSCAILRCMHVYVHAEGDLFSFFSEEIQAQILTPFQKVVVHDGTAHLTSLRGGDGESIELRGFHVKPLKTSASTVVKLLAKPDALAMKIFDKLGVRFVTKNLFDSFRVIRLLTEENLISFPHIMPDQSSNNLYPVDLFMRVCAELSSEKGPLDEEAIERHFQARLAAIPADEQSLFRKPNQQSGEDFRFIKFITRKLVEIRPAGKDPFSFFYPFEVQIMDESAHQAILSGPSEHEAYKERQRTAARKRLFPEGEPAP